MEKSERRKASEDAVNRRLQKLKKERSKKAKRNVELAKAADTGPRDFNVKKDSTLKSIVKEIKSLSYSIQDETLKKYVLEDFLEKIKRLTPIQNSKQNFKYFSFKYDSRRDNTC